MSKKYWKTIIEPTCIECGWKIELDEGSNLEAIKVPSSDEMEFLYCNNLLKNSSVAVIPSLGHKWINETLSPATCDKDGLVSFTCQRCGMHMDRCIHATGNHDFGDGKLVDHSAIE